MLSPLVGFGRDVFIFNHACLGAKNYGVPNLFICALVMFLNRVFRQERFNRFL